MGRRGERVSCGATTAPHPFFSLFECFLYHTNDERNMRSNASVSLHTLQRLSTIRKDLDAGRYHGGIVTL